MKITTTNFLSAPLKFFLPGLILLTLITHRVAGQTWIYMSTTTYSLTCPFPANTFFVDYPNVPGSGGGGGLCNVVSNANYDDQAIFVETFQTTNGQCIQVNFSPYSIILCAGDTLFLYDGPSTLSPPLGSFNSWDPECGAGFLTDCNGIPANVGATSQQVTFKFKPNNDGSNAKGWRIAFSCITCPGAPANDACSAATQLTPGALCNYTGGNTLLGTASAGIPVCQPVPIGDPNDDVWYKWVANNSSQTITVQGVGTTDPVLQVFSGICTALTSISCINATGTGGTETVNLTGLTLGSTYYYRVYDYSSASNTNTFAFNTCVVGSSPKDCTGASQICATNSITGTLNSGPGSYDCSNGTNCGCNVSGEFNSVWYRWQMLTSGTLEFNFVSSSGSTQDIDWDLWKVASATTCGSAMGAPIRCSYAVPKNYTQSGLPAYSTGTTTLEYSTDLSENATGTSPVVYSYVYAVTVTAGDYYVLLANLFSGASGYTLNWTLTNGASFTTCVLPVELVSFYGEKQDEMNMLRWVTASELNNDYFTLERSADGNRFTSLSTIASGGYHTSEQNYQYLDEYPLEGINYYRLKQTDYDGTFTYSNIITLENTQNHHYSPVIFPNPSSDIFHLSVTSMENRQSVVRIYNKVGQLVLSENFELLAGNNHAELDLSRFSKGVYTLQFSIGEPGEVFTRKLVKL